MQWEVVIGLEVHAQLKTKSKIFSGASTAFGAAPNTQACAIDLGMPGVLPVLNQDAVKMAVRFGLATNSQVAKRSVFARKNYFYPDLPKGYQISQYELPIVHQGHLDIQINGQTKRIGITRAHLEEDAGKSLHEEFQGLSGIDLNRAGTPLLEIVSEPDLRSAEEAVAYLKLLHALVVHLDICDGNMQEGSFRCDANVSIRPKGSTEFGTRTETKNINSFRYVEQAINCEIERQISVLESGGKIHQQTLLFDPVKQQSRVMRDKEEANDYRYFPDPDLLPVELDDQFIAKVKSELPELPQEKRERFIKDYKLSEYDAGVLTADKALASYFESVVDSIGKKDPKLAANWVMGDLSAALNKADIDIINSPVTATDLGQLLMRILDNTISGKIAKTVFEAMWNKEGTADSIIEKKGLKQVSDTGAIEKIIDEVMANNAGQVEQYRQGNERVFGFFVGQVMKLSQGKANPAQVNELLKKKLS
ncbi:Asp-tRNA(Asn)/Glu-tRNA(Gln) amidotransferase subunit GatB [Candidatus Berkiella aquae]|uniref:Aspartyl/glutamyl-tRNA(Asn/Gln) amidotransferase subunit B n=1 Tax=Candidatus Berkiella aquae TaxID=295108 RepID=A0A0Q9YVM9_9GAMM|nr:Asp-tRNA(Asn)/Glu-tRNA(Gln) amidotransferase subunit GatB [Candidatus Berkiella aquae]MCS5710706.1 Asp-tRNA(Asn)/Glu-tRNA(Gln) amidotransferase subunit GatB [Candidatus Berkiella aquae]